MNTLRKNAALKKFQLTTESKMEMLGKLLEGGYNPEEAEEIYEAMVAERANTGEVPNGPGNEEQPQAKANVDEVRKKRSQSGLAEYKKYKVKPIYKSMKLSGGRQEDVLTGLQRTGECLQTTIIEPRHAQLLNAQVLNTYTWYFAWDEGEFIDAQNLE